MEDKKDKEERRKYFMDSLDSPKWLYKEGREEEEELKEDTENRKETGRLKKVKAAGRWNFEGSLKCVGEKLGREMAVRRQVIILDVEAAFDRVDSDTLEGIKNARNKKTDSKKIFESKEVVA